MKIKLDENLPLQIKAGLAAFGHDVHTTHEEKLTGAKDSQIWAAAQGELHLRDSERANVETQFVLPGAALDGCPSFAFANNPRGFDRTIWTIRTAGRNATTSE